MSFSTPVRALSTLVIIVVLTGLIAAEAGGSTADPLPPGRQILGQWAVDAVGGPGIEAERWVGVMQFDAKGGCSLTIAANVLGLLPHGHESRSCTYQIGDDGMGTWRLDLGEGPIGAVFVLGGRGTQMRMLLTEPMGVNGSAEAIKQ